MRVIAQLGAPQPVEAKLRESPQLLGCKDKSTSRSAPPPTLAQMHPKLIVAGNMTASKQAFLLTDATDEYVAAVES